MDNTKQTCDIIRDKYPEFFKDNMWAIISTSIDHKDWASRVITRNDEDNLTLLDLAHDIKGLSLSSDDHFLPRI